MVLGKGVERLSGRKRSEEREKGRKEGVCGLGCPLFL